ncbi:MAG: hypothetical protein WBQ77_11515, partial [Methyloceanibacter sp.]|uniref:hypothetical protein n=1 Tax=Methyloceanibacter sp. TaxID=1965321 RepID=UPI003C330CB5
MKPSISKVNAAAFIEEKALTWSQRLHQNETISDVIKNTARITRKNLGRGVSTALFHRAVCPRIARAAPGVEVMEIGLA